MNILIFCNQFNDIIVAILTKLYKVIQNDTSVQYRNIAVTDVTARLKPIYLFTYLFNINIVHEYTRKEKKKKN